MILFITDPMEKTLKIDADPSASIRDLRVIFFQDYKREYNIVLCNDDGNNGIILKEDKSIKDCGFNEKSIIKLVPSESQTLNITDSMQSFFSPPALPPTPRPLEMWEKNAFRALRRHGLTLEVLSDYSKHHPPLEKVHLSALLNLVREGGFTLENAFTKINGLSVEQLESLSKHDFSSAQEVLLDFEPHVETLRY